MPALNFIGEAETVRPPETTDQQYIAFRCGDTHYGVPVMAVREIRSWTPTVAIPGRHAAARGVMDIRGTVVEVFDFGALLGGKPVVPSPGSVVLVLSLENKLAGALVDAVSDIIQAGPADLMPTPETGVAPGRQVKCMVNHEDRLLAILDLAAVFS